MYPPYDDLDLSGLPDNDEPVMEPVTDMDLDLSGLPDSGPSAQQQAQFDDSPTVLDWWGSYRKPMTDIGRRTAESINNSIPGMQSQHPHARFGRGAIDFLGSAVDELSAPINAIPTALTMGAGALKSGALSLLGRLASAPAAASGMQRMGQAEGIGEWGLGALEALGGIAGMRAPKVPTTAVQEVVNPPKAAPIPKPVVEAPVTTPKVPVTTSTSGKLNYSPTAEREARKVIAEYGYELPDGVSNKEIIDLAETMNPGYQSKIVKPVAPIDPDVSPRTSTKPKVKTTVNAGEFIHEDFPDYVLDKEGNVIRTLSGKPVQITPELERNLAMEVLNTPRAINASMDLSFPFRQGMTLIHKPAWWKAWGGMIKSGFGKDEAFKGVMDSILDKPNYKPNVKFLDAQGKPQSFADWSGLAITDMGNTRELEHMRSLAERIPGYKTIVDRSNRAYTAYANKLRSDVFDSLVDDFTKAGMDPHTNRELAKNIAGFVNTASGRGSVGELERYMEGLNVLMFSPRLQISRAQMAGKSARALFDPKVLEMSTPNVRREYLKSMLALGSAWGTAAALANQAGAEVSLDPTSSDFMKIKMGNTRLDPGAGFQQFIVLAARMAKQQTTSSTKKNLAGEYKTTNYDDATGAPTDATMGKDLGRFGYNKLAPLPRAGVDFAMRTQRDPFDPVDLAVRLGSPIIAQDIMEILTNEGVSPELLTTIPSAVGIGSQTYGDKNFDRRTVGPTFGADLRFPKKKKSTFR